MQLHIYNTQKTTRPNTNRYVYAHKCWYSTDIKPLTLRDMR
jgi:hypothetical protein